MRKKLMICSPPAAIGVVDGKNWSVWQLLAVLVQRTTLCIENDARKKLEQSNLQRDSCAEILRRVIIGNLEQRKNDPETCAENLAGNLHRLLRAEIIEPRTWAGKFAQRAEKLAQRTCSAARSTCEKLAQTRLNRDNCSENLRRETCRVSLNRQLAQRTCFAHYMLCFRCPVLLSFFFGGGVLLSRDSVDLRAITYICGLMPILAQDSFYTDDLLIVAERTSE